MMSEDAILLGLFALLVALANTLKEMDEATKPPFCPRCAHCNARVEAEKRRQQELRRELESRYRLVPPGAEEKGDARDEPPKPGGWAA